MAAEKQQHCLTVEEANKRLPLVRVIVGDIMKLFPDVHDRRRRLEEIRSQSDSSEQESDHAAEVRQVEQQLETDIERLEGILDELRELGAELKDPVRGLVDFRSVIDDREVWLCWQPGENEIMFWHELDAGFAGRQSLMQVSR